MSLFEYAQEVVSKKLERKKPMLSVSMGSMPMPDKMQTYMNRPVLPNTPAGKMDGSPFMEAAEKRGIPTTNRNMNMMVDLVNRGVPLEEAANLTEQKLMPMAQGGGLSSVQNSLNINGQPHRLAYINPSEENLLTQLGGSGRKIDGIPAYMMSGDNSGNAAGTDAANASAAEAADDEDSGTGPANSEPGPSSPATSGYGDTFDMQSIDDLSFDPSIDDPYAALNMKNVDPKSRSFIANINPYSFVVAPLATLAKAAVTTANNNNYGLDPMGVTANVGHAPSEANNSTDDAGGDDIIKEKIAAVKQVPVEEVTVAEVQRAKRLTAAQRVTGTRLEDILDDIYGSGKGSELLSLAQSGGGIASLQKNININGQPHQLSYINPSEENLLKQLGGSGEKVNGIPAYMMSGDNSGNAAGTDAANASAAADAANAAQDAAMGQVGGDVIPPEAVAIVPAVPEVIVPEVVEDVPKEPKVINKNLENILATSYPNLSPTEIARMLGGVSKEADPENNFETDAKIIEILKEEGNPFPTPDDIKKFKSESNIKTVLSQVYGNSNLLNNQTGTA